MRRNRVERRIEGRQTIENGFELRQIRIVIDEEGQRGVDVAERDRSLGEIAERRRSREVERTEHDVGDELAGIGEELNEGGEKRLHVDDGIEVPDDRNEALGENRFFRFLAEQKRDLLAVFAKTRESETEIRFIMLAREGERRERASDQRRESRADRRIDDRKP